MTFYITVHFLASGPGSIAARMQIKAGVLDEQIKEAVVEAVESVLNDFEPDISATADDPEVEYEVYVGKLKVV